MKVNILVCVKQVPKEEDLKLDPVTKTLIRSQGTGVISEYDKYAMELAARLKAEDGGKVTAVTMGPPSSMEVLRYCIAVGARTRRRRRLRDGQRTCRGKGVS